MSLLPPAANILRSRSSTSPIVAVIDGIGLSEQSLLLILHVCVELVERGHEIRLVVTNNDQGRVLDLTKWIVPRRLVGEITDAMVIAKSVRQVLVDAVVPDGYRVGICDLISRRSAIAFEEAGVPYYCTYAGTAKVLACAGVLPSVVAPMACGSLWIRKQSAMLADDVTAQRHAEEATEKELAKAAKLSYASAEAIFLPSFEDSVSPSFWNALRRRKPHNHLHFVRSVSIRPQLLPSLPLDAPYIRLLQDERSLPVIVIDLGSDEEVGLTVTGIRALFQGLCAGRDDWCAVWRVGDIRIFYQAISPSELDVHASWFVPLGIPVSDETENQIFEPPRLPLIQLLMHPRVACLVSNCGWSDCTAALSSGVPILALPVSAEQSLNAKALDDLGVAKVLWESLDQRTDGLLLNPPTVPGIRGPERFSRRHVAEAIRELISPESRLQLNSLNIQVSYYDIADPNVGAPAIVDIIETDLGTTLQDNKHLSLSIDDDDIPYDPSAAYLDDDAFTVVLAAKHVQCDAPCQNVSCGFFATDRSNSSTTEGERLNRIRHPSPKYPSSSNQRRSPPRAKGSALIRILISRSHLFCSAAFCDQSVTVIPHLVFSFPTFKPPMIVVRT